MIEPGEYTGTFVKVEFGKSENTGTPCMMTTWHIEEEDVDRTIYTYFTKNTMKHAMKKMESIGFNGDFENPEVSVEQTTLRCKEGINQNGDAREEWEFASWGGGASLASADKKTIKELNAIYKKEIGGSAPKAKKKKAAPAPASKTAAPAPEQEEEEVGDPESLRDDAWSAFVENKASEDAIAGLEEGKTTLAISEWSDFLSQAVPDKEEEDFTASDWSGVVKFMETPF